MSFFLSRLTLFNQLSLLNASYGGFYTDSDDHFLIDRVGNLLSFINYKFETSNPQFTRVRHMSVAFIIILVCMSTKQTISQ